jgi:hypothetical protein
LPGDRLEHHHGDRAERTLLPRGRGDAGFSLPPDHAVVELSIGCPLSCNQQPIIAELLNLAIEIGALGYRTLLVRRELANADLLSLLRGNALARFDCENVELDLVTAGRLEAQAC